MHLAATDALQLPSFDSFLIRDNGILPGAQSGCIDTSFHDAVPTPQIHMIWDCQGFLPKQAGDSGTQSLARAWEPRRLAKGVEDGESGEPKCTLAGP